MRRSRIFVDQPLEVGATLELEGRVHHYLAHVLRARVDMAVVLFNGDGQDYPARIRAIERRSLRVEIEGAQPVAIESPLRLRLVQALARGDRIDLTLQKAVELGAQEIALFSAERSQGMAKKQREKRLAHWRGILVAACEQCGRARIPSLQLYPQLADALAAQPQSRPLILHPQASQPLPVALADGPDAVSLVIGPEGGFSPAELATADAHGCQAIGLGPRILRTETAAITTLGLIQALAGDLLAPNS